MYDTVFQLLCCVFSLFLQFLWVRFRNIGSRPLTLGFESFAGNYTLMPLSVVNLSHVTL